MSIEKSTFHVNEFEYLGYYRCDEGINMSLDKVKTVGKWPTFRNIQEIQAFLGFANVYWGFINGFSKICQPLTENVKKRVKFSRTEACEAEFKDLKLWFSSIPILSHFDPDLETKIETNASNFAKNTVVSQFHQSTKTGNRWPFIERNSHWWSATATFITRN